MVLGWIGSGTTVKYLDLVRPALEGAARRCPGVRLQVVGAEWEGPGSLPVACKPWRLEDEVADLRGFDVGLMPIADDPWTRGKGGYKLLQYMAAGLPVVAHPVGVNARIVVDGGNGLWARTPAEWEEALVRLASDADLRHRMGRAGRQMVADTYSLRAQQGRLLDLLRAVAEAA